jgi:flagellar motor switch protein FliM
MKEVLSQHEIDELLSAIDAGMTDGDAFEPDKDRDVRKVRIYDFKRPDKFSREQIRTMSIIHEYMAKYLTTYFSGLLGVVSHIHVASVDQLTYEEFIRSIPTPTCLSLIRFNALGPNSEPDYDLTTFKDEPSLIEIDPAITKSILHFITGGNDGSLTTGCHEMTELETVIMMTPIQRMLGYMREAWANVCDIRPRIGAVETNPQYCQAVPPTEMCVLITLEAKIGEVEGMMNICYPDITLSPIMDKLTAQWWYNDFKSVKPQENADISNIKIELTAELFSRITTYGMLKMQRVGDWIQAPGDLPSNQCRLKSKNKYLLKAVVVEPQPNGIRNKRIRVNEIKNITEENYMEEKNNVAITSSSLNDVQVQLSVELGRTKRQIKDILQWGEGSMIELDELAGEPVKVFVNNVLFAKGEVVVIDENFGVRLTELMGEGNAS